MSFVSARFAAAVLTLSLAPFSMALAQAVAPAGSFLAQYDKPSQVLSLKEAAGNLSGITYNSDTDTYFVIQNNSYQFVEYDKTLTKALRVIKLLNLPDRDTEDIAYLGQDQFAINTETNQIVIFTLKPGQTSVDVNPRLPEVQLLTLPPPGKKNQGVEGLCFTKKGGKGAGLFYAVQESRPKRVFAFPRPLDMMDITSSRKMVYAEPYDAERIFKHVMSDLAGCAIAEKLDHLIILSQESQRLMELTFDGKVVGTKDLPRDVGIQYEGITMGPDGELVLVGEDDKVMIFKSR